MSTTDSRPERFPSMDALRHANEHLFDTIPESDRKLTPEQREANAKLINEFIDRVIATGVILDTLPERREAQGLIDFWVTSPSLKPRSRVEEQESLPASSAAARRYDNQLERFNPQVIQEAAASGDAFVKALSAKQKDLARQILLSLIKVPESGEEFQSTPVARDTLHKIGNPTQVDKLLTDMEQKGVLRSSDDGTKFALRYPALTRHWEWLAEELKPRMNLRDLALGWVNSGRPAGALLGWKLTRKFRRYSNLAPWETEFLNRSARDNWITYGSGAVGLAIILLGFGWKIYWEVSSRRLENQVATINRELRSPLTSPSDRAAKIKRLAEYRKELNVANMELADEDVNLDGLDGSGAVFDSTRLSGVHFKKAALTNASFTGSVIRASSFADAKLSRARFDMVDFCADVDFSGADVAGASFRRVAFSDQHPPNFSRVAWWTAYGWGFDDIERLARSYPRGALSAKGATELGFKVKKLEERGAIEEKALRWNEIAWTLALEGFVGGGQAQASVQQAIGLLDQLKLQPGDELTQLRAGFEDTLGYILLQQGELETDAEKKRDFVERAIGLLAHASEASDETETEVLFRYAVALNAAGRPEATAKLEKALQAYEPSHELYLLNSFITGNFKQRIVALTGKVGQRRLPTRCGK